VRNCKESRLNPMVRVWILLTRVLVEEIVIAVFANVLVDNATDTIRREDTGHTSKQGLHIFSLNERYSFRSRR
jgi:hypothetical protein